MEKLYLSSLIFVLINPFFNKKTYKYYLFLLLILLTYFAFHLVLTPNMDLYRRAQDMELYQTMGFSWVVENRMSSNPLGILLFYAFSGLGPNYLAAFTAFLCYGIAFYLLLKCAKRYNLTKQQMNYLLLFFCLNVYYDHLISNTRIYICYALVALFLYREIVEKKNKWLSWVIYILCCYIHYAAVLFVCVRIVLIFYNKFKKFPFILIFLALIFSGVGLMFISRIGIQSNLLMTITGKVDEYANYRTFGKWQFLSSVLRIGYIIAIYFYVHSFYKEGYVSEKKILFYLAIVSAVLIGMISNYQLIYRTPNFYHYLGMIGLCILLIDKSKIKKRSWLNTGLKATIIVSTLYTFFYQVYFIYPSLSFVF